MSLNLYITAGTLPALTPLPGNAQAINNQIAAYCGIAGDENFDGINYGSSIPSSDNQDKPWFKTDTLGNPIGLFSWNGLAWTPIPSVVANGPSAQLPSNPAVGTEFYNTDISCLVIWNGANWSTASGSIGDIKDVMAADLNTALLYNPGWSAETSTIGCVIAAAGAATSITAAHSYNTIIGEEAHTQQITELPSHTHPTEGGGIGPASATGNVENPSGILAASALGATQATGGGQPFNVIQPTYYAWRIVKTS
jgi:hypothetical protein